MTEQTSEIFTNECPDICLEGYALYGIQKNHPTAQKKRERYPFKTKTDPSKMTASTDCWKGFFLEYLLDKHGKLFLKNVFYKDGDIFDSANEQLIGNFWLEFRTEFFGDFLYVPFWNGIVEKNTKKWVVKKGIDKRIAD